MSQHASLSEPIRPHWGDLADVARIQLASFRRDLAYKRWMLVFFWLTPGVTFLITKHDEAVTGCIIADTHLGRTRVVNIAVHPQYRHQGIGRFLMSHVMAMKPAVPVVLMVQEENAAAQALYTQLGFVRTGYMKAYYGAGNAGIEMTLRRP